MDLIVREGGQVASHPKAPVVQSSSPRHRVIFTQSERGPCYSCASCVRLAPRCFLWFDILSAVGDCGERSFGISASKGIRQLMEETGTLLDWKLYFLWQEPPLEESRLETACMSRTAWEWRLSTEDLRVTTTHHLPSSTYAHCHICTWFIHFGLFGSI